MMKVSLVFLFCVVFVSLVSAEVFFREDFDDNSWTSRWVKSTFKGDEAGDWTLTHGKWYGDAKKDMGLQTAKDARFYQLSAKFPEFSNKGKNLVLQYSVKHEQSIDCGGGYLKVLPAGLDQKSFQGDSEYNIMFGPDICGSTKRVHVIFNYKGKNHLIKKEIPCESDELSHLYTLIVKPDNTYEVLIDGVSKQTGSLKEDWDMLAPRKIKDPSKSKPSDWDDRSMIPDPTDTKPAGWDDIPEQIADPKAKKPEDWDDELDGEWEAPMIDNPDYKGEWQPKQIPNPAYKGEWVHPEIDNPDFVDDDNLYKYDSNAFVGFELWQVKSGTIFDRILLTDSVDEAATAREDFLTSQKAEKAMYEKAKEAERAKAEEERKKAEAADAKSEDKAEADAEDKTEL